LVTGVQTCALPIYSSAAASGRDDIDGSNTTSAIRAAWKNSTIIATSATIAWRCRHAPHIPIANAKPATASGARKYANEDIVKSVICPSDSVYTSGFEVKADAI